MNSELDAENHHRPDPGRADDPARRSAPVFEARPGVVTITFEARQAPTHFSFAHDRTRGLYIITQPDGTTELFRDNPARYLVVEPDPQTDEMRSAAKFGRPVYLYLCREHRDS